MRKPYAPWPWIAILLTLIIGWSAKRLLDSSPKFNLEPHFRSRRDAWAG